MKNLEPPHQPFRAAQTGPYLEAAPPVRPPKSEKPPRGRSGSRHLRMVAAPPARFPFADITATVRQSLEILERVTAGMKPSLDAAERFSHAGRDALRRGGLR